MTRKAKSLLAINLPPPLTSGGSQDSGAVDDVLPPASPTIDAPINLSLSSSIVYSSASPQAAIDATWDSVGQATPSYYVVQVSLNSTFTATGTITAQSIGPSAHIEGLLPGTLYYVRVKAVAGRLGGEWSDTASITTDTDTVPAGVPTSPLLTWIGVGDALITWTNPTEANFKDVVITVRASSGGTIYGVLRYSAAGRFLYTLAMNRADTAGVGDSSLYVELQSRTFSNVLGTKVNTGLVTKSAPALPTGFAQSWTGDAGTAGPDLTMSWTKADDAAFYKLTLDSVARSILTDRYTYTLDANRAEHAGTPDPAIAYVLQAIDGFGQVSTAVSGTATNASPVTPTATLEQGAVSGLHATVTSTPPADFLAYEFVFKRESTTVATVVTPQSSAAYPMQGAADQGYHSWTVTIRQKDAFGQFSGTVTPAAVAFEALTLTSLRALISYTDSLSTSPSTLKTAFSDGITTSGGVSYAA